MKTKSLFLLLFILLIGCTDQKPAVMTLQEQETAKKEVRDVVSKIFQAANKLDLETLFQFYLNTPDFLLVHLDGSILDYQGAKNVTGETINSLSFVNYSIIKDEYRFLPDNIVICAWNGKCEMTLKTGDKFRLDKIGITFVCKKVDDNWKVIYSHRSASPRIQENIEK